MKKIISLLLVLTAIPVFAGFVQAQTRTGYFVRNSLLNHKMNAAFAPDHGFVGIPALTNMDLSIESNMGMSTFMYPLQDGSLGTFMHPDVDPVQFLGSLAEKNYVNLSFDMDIFNVGFFTGKKRTSFWTIDVGMRNSVSATLPKELFRFAKCGMSSDPSTYSIRDLNLNANSYLYASLGYSRGLDEWVKGLRIGGKAKFLVGIMDISATIDRMDIDMSSDMWRISSAASGYMMAAGPYLKYDSDGAVNGIGFDPSALGVSGYGASFDLGAVYEMPEDIADGLRFSLSVTDLGFISYSGKSATAVSASKEVVYDGSDNLLENGGNLGDEFSELGNQMLEMVAFRQTGSSEGKTVALAATLNVGADYSFLKDKMNVGLLYSARFDRFKTEHELTLVYNYAPARWFDIALSYSFLNSRQSVGWLITLVPRKVLNFFIGSDYTYLSMTPQGLPVNKAYFNVNFGISVPLSKNIKA